MPSRKTAAAKRPAGKRPRRRHRAAGLLLFLLLALLAAGGWMAWMVLHPFRGYSGPFQDVVVPSGMSAARILDRLAAAGVVADARLARLYLVYVLRNPPLQAGEYRFSAPLATPDVLRKLVRGDVIFHPVTLVEGLSMEETAAVLARAGAGRLPSLLQAMRSPERIVDLDPLATDLEGYLFPETYRFAAGISEQEVVASLVKTFRDRSAPLRVTLTSQPKQGDAPHDLHALVTLASIVEKEAHESAERPVIAAVYLNRLRLKMGLGADPTVIFALKRLGRWDGTIHKDDLRVDSPYNTYRYAGLPPGPICSPGLASLEAAAHPAAVPYLYFVSRNDGTHVFSTTLAEHNRNVDIWQKRYWRERRLEARRKGASGAVPARP
jgi:UPF0755 protein